MRTADEIRIELEEARERVADLLRTEYESLPAEEQESYVAAVAEAEERVRRLEEELKASA
jgi:exonuclease VII small subunit